MQTKNNIENPNKVMKKDKIMQLAKDVKDIEFDMLNDILDTIKSDYEESKSKGESLNDWIDRQPDNYFKRLTLKEGGVVDLAKYRKSKEPKLKKINLAQGDFEKTVADVSETDRDVIKRLLRMSGINVGGKD
jgi:hypothetical protein